MDELGSLQRLDPRDIWPNEARDFTPWLAENISGLGATLGLELELVEREASVGRFSLDIHARDHGTQRPVVIENQFGATDHDHLGKLLTYAGGLDAGVVVWLGQRFREEHRQALDWLNQRTDSLTHFFAVEVEVLQIDESRPAYNFKLVVSPNEWQKRSRSERTTNERDEAYREYFQGVINVLREEYSFTTAKLGQPQSWYAFASGLAGISYCAGYTTGNRTRVEVYLGRLGDMEFNRGLFDWLKEQQSDIEEEFGESLDWEPLEKKIACRIALYRTGSIKTGPLEELQKWHVEKLLRLKKVFGPRLIQFKNASV